MSDNSEAMAPIALFAHNRPQHLENCISSLRRNAESERALLYCFLDGPRTEKDLPLVQEVREIARSARGFLEVRIKERNLNWGLSRNIIDGVTHVVTRHNRVIVVEDDLVVSPSFLTYMNQALVFYQSTPGVFSVSGYNYPRRLLRVPVGYPDDAFFVMRHMCWGWGTWADRWKKADWSVREYASLSRNESWKRSFREGGVDLPGMLDAQVNGHLDSWAIRWTHTHFIHHAVCLVPVDSLVNNMGTDGSGVHMKPSTRYFHPRLNCRTDLHLPPFVYVDPQIARMYKTAERRSFLTRVAKKVSRVIRNATVSAQSVISTSNG